MNSPVLRLALRWRIAVACRRELALQTLREDQRRVWAADCDGVGYGHDFVLDLAYYYVQSPSTRLPDLFECLPVSYSMAYRLARAKLGFEWRTAQWLVKCFYQAEGLDAKLKVIQRMYDYSSVRFREYVAVWILPMYDLQVQNDMYHALRRVECHPEKKHR